MCVVICVAVNGKTMWIHFNICNILHVYDDMRPYDCSSDSNVLMGMYIIALE